MACGRQCWFYPVLSEQAQESGDDGEEVTPVPIPNTEVKLFSADGSRGLPPVRVGRRRADRSFPMGMAFFIAFFSGRWQVDVMYCIRLVEERSAVIQGGLFRDITLSGVPAMLYGKLALPGAYYQQLVGDISTLEELSAVV